jgi:16S rRNA G966 N2-methylase RsmD
MFGNEATWQFIDEHLQDDVRQLALQKNKYKDIDFEFALQQIQGRQKTRDKLPFLASIPRFVFPPTLALEQCSSEITAKYKRFVIIDLLGGDARPCVSTGNGSDSVFGDGACSVSTNSIWADWVIPVHVGASMSDLTGGFGIDTIFLSNLFEACHYVEPQQQLCDILSHNLKLLQKHNVMVHQDTMEHFIESMDSVDLVYLDPSRRDMLGKKVAGIEDCTPNVLQYKELLLQKGKSMMLKLSPMLDIKRALAQLPETKEIYVLAVNGECKELLFVMDNYAQNTVKFHTVNFHANVDGMKESHFDFTEEEEQIALPEFVSKLGQYLYEPNAAVLKAGAFKSVAVRYGLCKLHPHSHLYTSDILINDFPGRIFQVQDVYSYKEAKAALQTIRKANLTVRNFPLSADELKKSLKLSDGGEVYLFGTTLHNGQKVIISCIKENVK